MKTQNLEITWLCPKCKHVNLDDYGETTQPMCSSCEIEYDWQDIIAVKVIEQKNRLLKEKGVIQ